MNWWGLSLVHTHGLLFSALPEGIPKIYDP